MLNMAPMTAASAKLGQVAELDDSAPAAGLNGLLSSLNAVDQAFSAELQMLMQQASPELLQRLEQRLAGGMSLPQAAREFLAERSLGKGDEGLIRWLQQRLPDFQERLAVAVESARELDRGGERRQVQAAAAAVRLAEGFSGAQSASASADPAPLSAATGKSAISPQLANQLLQMGIPQPLGGRAWEGALGDRVVWMVQGDQQLAKLTLNPPNLGPLEVRVSVHQDQTSVTFLSPHAAVREAVEAALPRLRELFEQQDMLLARADIGDPGAQREGLGDNRGTASTEGGDGQADGMMLDSEEAAAAVQGQVQQGLVDLFA